MAPLVHPFFGDLYAVGIILSGWTFVLVLIGDAWWQKRRARALREQAGRTVTHQSTWRVAIFFKRFRWLFAVLAVVPVVAVILVRGEANESSDTNHLIDYATNFQEDATYPVTVHQTPDLALDNPDPAGAQNSTRTDRLILTFGPLSAPCASEVLTNTADLKIPASGLKQGPVKARNGSGKAR